MTTEYAGTGGPARILELLWGVRKPPSRGPKPGLTVPRIVRAAIQLADAEGLAAMSIRGVAEALGVGAMTLYRCVTGYLHGAVRGAIEFGLSRILDGIQTLLSDRRS